MSPTILKPCDVDVSPLLFDNSPLPYLVLHSHTLQIVKANTAAARFFNHTAYSMESYCFTHFLLPEETAHGLLKKFCTSNTTPFFLVCKTSACNTTLVQVFQNPIPAAEPLLGVMLAPAPLPVATQAERLAGMVNETSDVLTAADLDFKPITWSNAAEELYGITCEQAINQNLRKYIEIQYTDEKAKDVRYAARTHGVWKGEMSFVRPTDGKKLTLLVTFKLIKNKQGVPLHFIVSGTDISDRKEAEAKLRESENRFREVADSAPVGIWMSEVENKVIYINKPMADYAGVQPQAFNKAIWISLIHPDDADEVLKKFRQHFQERLPVTLIYRLKRPNGDYHWVQDSGTPRFLSNGTFLGYIGSIIDINDTKRREAELQYQAILMNNVLDSVVTTDLNFVVQSWNKVAAEIYGYTEEEIVGKRLPDFSHFKYISCTKEQALQQLQEDGVWRGEVDINMNEERNFLFTVTYITDADKKRIGIMAVGREITDRKRAEKAVQESEVYFRSLITNALDCILLTDAAGTITFASPSIKRILGYETEEAVGRSTFDFVHPDDHAYALTAFSSEIAGQTDLKFIQARILKQDGTWLWCMVRGHNLLDNPQLGCVAIYLHDDSQRKAVTDALQESEQRFRALIKDVKLGVTLENEDGKILMYNKAMADLFRVSEAVFETANLYDLFKNAVHEDETHFERDAWPAHRAARTKKPVEDVVVGIRLAGSERVWLLINANPVLDDDGAIRHIISSFSDVTERKKLVQRLMDDQLNQQRLLTQATIDGQERERKEIGKELHDNVGQQLATAKLYLDLIKGPEMPNRLELLNRATKSIVDIINEVRTISHSLVPPTLGDLGLVESIKDLADTVGLLQQLHITFDASHFTEQGLPENAKLMLYRIIQEALNNIIKHAAATTVHIRLKRRTGLILLQLTDNGQGFDPAKVRKGLGLTNIRNRAELFGGKISLKAAPGEGCTLGIMIPDAVRCREN